MSQTARSGDASAYPERSRMQHVEPTRMTAWVGWIAFAGTVMVIVGIFHVFQGLVALFQDDYFLVGRSGLAVGLDFTTWGWIHVIGGALVAVAGLALFTGRVWARAVGVVLAMVSAIVNVGFLAAYPIWCSMMIAFDVLVIWALTVHGGEMRQ